MQPEVEHLEGRTLLSDLIRKSPAQFADGISSPSLPGSPNPRLISNIVNNQVGDTSNGRNLSAYSYIFGQFLDHDLSFTPDGIEQAPIPAPAGDPIGTLPFNRSAFDPTTGTSASNPRQLINAVTPALDLSQVYGSDDKTTSELRTGSGGLLKTSDGDLLPYATSQTFPTGIPEVQNEGPLSRSQLFAAGDLRVNEGLELTAMTTLWVRNHNRIAAELAKTDPTLSDEQLFQEARKLNVAAYQNIVYTGWLPDVGITLPAYRGFDPGADPRIADEFSTVAFRFGHSTVNDDVERHDNSGQPIPDVSSAGSSLPLAIQFFDANLITATPRVDPLTGHTSSGIDPILKYGADTIASALDPFAVDGVRNLLFGNGGTGGEDLIARDIQRGRDHGLPGYNAMRVAYGLPAVNNFAQISSDSAIAKALKDAYGSVSAVDAFEGGLAEDHGSGSDFGPLFQAIITDQFTRTRDGDPAFFGAQPFTAAEKAILAETPDLGSVVKANTGITNLQGDVFVFRAQISGTVSQATGPATGVLVQLLDPSSQVLATTHTDSNGRYQFNQQSGVRGTGTYTVKVLVPGNSAIPPAPKTIRVDHGDVILAADFAF